MEKKKTRNPEAAKAIMDLHLAKFNYYMSKKDWKSAVIELQLALNAVIDILEYANSTLKKVAERYQETSRRINKKRSIKTEKLSNDTIVVQYPGNKIVLKKINP